MTVIIHPFIEQNKTEYFATTIHRLNNLFTPIQATNQKESDLLAYLATPVIDLFILEPVYAIDASIHLLNAFASYVKALHLWTMNQQNSAEFIDLETEKESSQAWGYFIACGSALFANAINSLLSIIALLTRPIASLVHTLTEESEPTSHYQYI